MNTTNILVVTAITAVGAFLVVSWPQSGRATSATPITYYGWTFQAGVPIKVNYRFNTHRISYVAPILARAREAGWDFRLGGTIGIRDAEIKLAQGGISRDFSNVGPIPLLYASATKTLSRDWNLYGEFAFTSQERPSSALW